MSTRLMTTFLLVCWSRHRTAVPYEPLPTTLIFLYRRSMVDQMSDSVGGVGIRWKW